MGLLDILNSIGSAASDPRARPAPAGPATNQAGSQGMSPMAKAMLALLAIYAQKHMQRADAPTPRPAPQPAPRSGSAGAGPADGGNLGDLLRGTLGGVRGAEDRGNEFAEDAHGVVLWCALRGFPNCPGRTDIDG